MTPVIGSLVSAAVIVGLYVLVFFNPNTALNTPFSIPVEWALGVTGGRPVVAYAVAVLVVAAALAWARS